MDHILTVINMCCILDFRISSLVAFHTSFTISKNITVLLISGAIKLQSYVMIIESFSSQASKVQSLSFGLVLRRWLSLSFPLRMV